MTAKKKKMDETMIKPLANSARFDKHPHWDREMGWQIVLATVQYFTHMRNVGVASVQTANI